MCINDARGALVLIGKPAQHIEPLHWSSSQQTYRKSADGVDGEGVSLVVAHLCGIVRWICGG